MKVETPKADPMPSAYKPPDPKRQLSARIRGSILDRVASIVALWRERAEIEGKSGEDIDTTYVLEALLDSAADAELEQWGGNPTTPERMKAAVQRLRDAAKR